MLAAPLLLALCAQAPTAATAPIDAAQVQALLDEMTAAEAHLIDSSFTMHKREWHGGRLTDELLVVKFRKPGKARLEWPAASKENSGRALSYASGKLTVRIGFLNLDLDDDSALVKSESRHPPKDIGFPHTINILAANFAQSRRDGLIAYLMLPKRSIFGQSSSCYRTHADKPAAAHAAGYYGVDSEICIGDATHMPLLVKVWNVEDGAYRLVEDYEYENVQLNVGLVDKDVTL